MRLQLHRIGERLDEPLRRLEMFYNVEQEHVVEIRGSTEKIQVVQIVLVEGVELNSCYEEKEIDTGYMTARLTKTRAEVAARAAKDQDAATRLHEVKGECVWTLEVNSRLVTGVLSSSAEVSNFRS